MHTKSMSARVAALMSNLMYLEIGDLCHTVEN